jgi:hypothetical protein
MADEQHLPNGRPTWRDLQQSEERCREAIAAHEASVTLRLDRAHGFANDRLDSLLVKLDKAKQDSDAMAVRELAKSHEVHTAQERRLSEVESVLDQQRGAKALVYFLIGSNLMVLVGIIVAVVAVAGE